MNKLYLYNTLSRQKEKFKPIKKNLVGLYTCGPTVYNYAHIGNFRTYIFEDILKRALIYNDYEVKHVMNITDVGHLTGDRDMGEDKLELGAKREGKTARQIAEFYTQAFREDMKKLNISEPDIWCKATDYIEEQIELIKILENKGYAYKTSDGVYFDTSKFKDYNKLSHLKLEDLKEGARVEKNNEKRNPTDFALWKFSPKGVKRQQEWDPKEYGADWGVGFPGWHIECSTMSMKELGSQLDIHCGGIDHINIHHTNEIAQSEAATGKKFFNYWLHGAFLNIAGGKKMAKSESGFLTLENALIDRGYHPLAYRFMALSVHYRKPMEWSNEAVDNAQYSLNKLNKILRMLKHESPGYLPSEKDINENCRKEFLIAISDDLNMPIALAVAQKMLRSNISNKEKISTILDFDKVFGLKLKDRMERKMTNEFKDNEGKMEVLRHQRAEARVIKDFEESDRLRNEIERLGYIVEDTKDGQMIIKK